jgi:hypothetical protein
VALLPSDKTKADIHQIYQETAKLLNYRVISLLEFKQLWLEQCPQIILIIDNACLGVLPVLP